MEKLVAYSDDEESDNSSILIKNGLFGWSDSDEDMVDDIFTTAETTLPENRPEIETQSLNSDNNLTENPPSTSSFQPEIQSLNSDINLTENRPSTSSFQPEIQSLNSDINLTENPPSTSSFQPEIQSLNSDINLTENRPSTPSFQQEKQSFSDNNQPSTSEEGLSNGRRKKYALQKEQVTKEIGDFMGRVRTHFTATINLSRASSRIEDTTIFKVEERLRCYLGYVTSKRNEPVRDVEIFVNEAVVQSYFDFLQDERGLAASTICNHANALLYAAKYIYRDHAPKYTDVRFITQLKATATALQKQGDLERPKTLEELKALNKWLSWEQILEAFERQRDTFEMAIGMDKSIALKDLLIIAIYCHLPPSRALEVRTLQYYDQRGEEKGPFVLSEHTGKNMLVQMDSADIILHIQDYKTKKHKGYDQVKIEVGTELNRLLQVYFSHHRTRLLGETSHDFVFMNSQGSPFSSSCFSKHLQKIFWRLTGQKISVNILRSSFVTYAYSHSNCSDNLKDSIAVALRHSRRQAQLVYDRRTANQKKAEAVAFTQTTAESSRGDVSVQEGDDSSSSDDHDVHDFPIGSFVGLVEQNSTLKAPKVLIGRVNRHEKKRQARLLHYENVRGKNYKLNLDGEEWIEKLDSLISVSMVPSKKMPDQYVLCTSLRSIHKQVKK